MSTKNPTKALPADRMPVMNRIRPSHDKEILRLRHIKSPDISAMPYSYYDEKMKFTKYFPTLERKNEFLKRLEGQVINSGPTKRGERQSKSESNQ